MSDVLRVKKFVKALVRPVRNDLNQDPLLPYILIFGTFVAVMGIWIRVPNFAGPDEYSRLLQPMKVAGRVLADPGINSIQTAVTDGRSLGATFYLYAIVLVPMFLVVLATGNLGQFMTMGSIESRWVLWHEVPAWFWTGSILIGRAMNVLLAVASLYILYRLGVRVRNRRTGRVAALGLTVTFGFIEVSHTINEDIPMLFLLLCTLLFGLRYIGSGAKRSFFLACFTAGLSVAFKVTGGSAVIAVGIAYVLRVRKDVKEPAIQPKLLLGGLAIGIATIFIGFPSVLVGGPEELWTRVTHTSGQKTASLGGIPAGIGFWLLRGYLSTFGLPLLGGVIVGIVTTLWYNLFETDRFDERIILLATPIVVTLGVFSQWQYVRVHHLLPTVPALLLISALGFEHLRQSSDKGVQLLLAFLFITSAAFTGVGTLEQITDPRDKGTDWLRENTVSGENIEVYENSVADVAAIHGRPLQHYDYMEENATYSSSLILNETAYTEWMINMTTRQPEYIQLTGAELDYITQGHPRRERHPQRAAYIEGLLNGKYNYTVAAKFGAKEIDQSLSERLLWAGFKPHPESRESIVVIFERRDSKRN